MSRGDTKDLQSQRYHGIILKDIDPLNQGRYKVWISELMHQIPKTEGIWCKNRTHKNRVGKTLKDGSYQPLQPGTEVLVVFYENDFNNGFITERESDQDTDSLPFSAKMEDRDKIYLIQSSGKGKHVLAMIDDATSVPGNSVHLYANNKNIKIILNSSGLHIFSGAAINITSTGDFNFKSNAGINLESSSAFNIKAGGAINIQGSSFNSKAGSVNLQGNSSPINGQITYASQSGIAGGIGGVSAPGDSAGSAGSASGNPGYNGPGELK
jgi:hypothetical protein